MQNLATNQRGDFFEEVSLHKVYGPSGSREREAPAGGAVRRRLLKSGIYFHGVAAHLLAFCKCFKAASLRVP